MVKTKNFSGSWKWDRWQEDLISYKGSVSARCGRQTGKSTAVGKRASENLVDYVSCRMLMTAPAQRQSAELFIKMMGWLDKLNEKVLKSAGGYVDNPKFSYKRNMELRRRFEYDHGIYNENPTKTTVILKLDFSKPRSSDNKGSVCVCLPAGKTGVYLRFLALDFLYIDEAAFVPEIVYDTLRPMLAVSAKLRGLGWECLLSTPFGKGGFFYNSQMSPDFKQFHVSAENCNRYTKSFLAKEKVRMSKVMYKQEYLAEFAEEWNQFFSTELLKRSMTFIDWDMSKKWSNSRFYLGLDVARYGDDEIAYVIIEYDGNRLRAVKIMTAEKKSTVETVARTLALHQVWNFKMLFIDDSGVGGGVLDLLQDKIGKRVVMGLNNASKSVEVQGDEKRRSIFKEDLYSNALVLLEQKKLELISDLRLLRSLKSITFEYSTKIAGRVTIFGNYSHLAEALVRACWCVKEKGLNIYLY